MRISIITVVLNSATAIADCISSLHRQDHPDIEHLIIDGGSTDGTLDIIRDCASPDTMVVSEADEGLYDAMNKGIRLSTGEIIGFLHSDDLYADHHVLSDIAAVFRDPTVDACYGDLVYVDPRHTERIIRYWKSAPYHDRLFYRGWMPPHPTFFVRRRVYESYGTFRLDLGTAADYELMLRFLLKKGITARYLPRVLVKMRMGGKSNASLLSRLRANRNDRKAWQVNGLTPYPWTLLLKPLSKIRQYIRF